MENIDTATREKIVRLICALVPTAKVYLFGSRARGTHGKASDIDLAVDAGHELSDVCIDEVKSVLGATNIRYKIDVVDFHGVSADMKASIKRDGKLWKS